MSSHSPAAWAFHEMIGLGLGKVSDRQTGVCFQPRSAARRCDGFQSEAWRSCRSKGCEPHDSELRLPEALAIVIEQHWAA